MAVGDKMLRYNEKKHKYSLVPESLIKAASRGLGYGCIKYERDDWRSGGKWTEVMDSLLRHTFAFLDGEDNDQESGLCHIDHMSANLAFLADFKEKNYGEDDRRQDLKRMAAQAVRQLLPATA